MTLSVFGLIYHKKPDTAPDALVVNLLDQWQVISPAIKWGIEHESEALEAYEEHQNRTGHTELTVRLVGFCVSIRQSFLGASPDGGVYDPSNIGEPYGFAEVKCPFKHQIKQWRNSFNKNVILTTAKSKGRWLLVFVPGVTLLCTHLKELVLSMCIMIRSSRRRTYCLSWNSFTINVLHLELFALSVF